jgi:hypothetical protein
VEAKNFAPFNLQIHPPQRLHGAVILLQALNVDCNRLAHNTSGPKSYFPLYTRLGKWIGRTAYFGWEVRTRRFASFAVMTLMLLLMNKMKG